MKHGTMPFVVQPPASHLSIKVIKLITARHTG